MLCRPLLDVRESYEPGRSTAGVTATLRQVSSVLGTHPRCEKLVLIYRTPQLLTLQTKRGINRPMITVQMVATPHHTGLTLHMLRNKHVVQLKEATLVGVSVRPAGAMVPLNMWKIEAMVEGTQSTQTKGMHPLGHSFAPTRRCTVCIRMNYGNQSNLQDLEPDSHSDQIQSQLWRCHDDGEG